MIKKLLLIIGCLLLTIFLSGCISSSYPGQFRSPQENGRAISTACQPHLEIDQKTTIDIFPNKEYLSSGNPLYIDKETKNWVLIKKEAPIPSWKVWGGKRKTRDGVSLPEMEEIGTTTDGQRVFIGLGHCNGDPGKTCLDPMVQDAIFVVTKEGLSPPLPNWAKWKNEAEDPQKEGYWWLFNVYLDLSLLPENPTDDDLPCWTKLACAGDLIVDGGKRRQAMMEEYLRTGVCPVGEDPAAGVSAFAEGTPIPSPEWEIVRPEKRGTLQLGTFYPKITEFRYEWWTPSCKPVVYLYPEKPTKLSVKINPFGQLTRTDPPYDPKKGWEIIAYPDGTIETWEVRSEKLDNEAGSGKEENRTSHFQNPASHLSSPTSYPYLFYEGIITRFKIPDKGWVIKKENLSEFFGKVLPQLGLNKKEARDFKDYWLARLTKSPYFLVSLLPQEEIKRIEPVKFSVEPDTFIRVRFYFKNLDSPILISPPSLPLFPERQGFTAVEWGGLYKQSLISGEIKN